MVGPKRPTAPSSNILPAPTFGSGHSVRLLLPQPRVKAAGRRTPDLRHLAGQAITVKQHLTRQVGAERAAEVGAWRGRPLNS
jgi:hypothetical protein